MDGQQRMNADSILSLLIDAHAHLTDGAFSLDLPEVLARARAARLGRILVVAETLAESRAALDLALRHPLLAPAAGLYPTFLDPVELEGTLDLITAHRSELLAVGEIGLDHWKVQDPKDQEIQRDFFLRQVRLALELDLPVNVHSRSAGRQAIAALIEAGAQRVLLHAFDGKAGHALDGVRAGFFFSIPPSVVRSPQKQKLVRALPLEYLILETDSPVLGPAAGQRNEPANLQVALEAVAEIKGLPVEDVARATTENALRLFGPQLLPIS